MPSAKRLALRMKVPTSAKVASRSLFALLSLAATGALAQSGYGLGGSGFGGSLTAGGISQSGYATGTGLRSTSEGAEGAGGRAYFVTPTLSAFAELTNNVNLSATDKKSDLILGISPGIQLGGQTGRVRGFLTYNLIASYYVSQSERATFRNLLDAQGNAELISDWLFVDASANISQEFISPFGTQSGNPTLNNDNRTEVSTVRVSPYITGQIAGQVNYLGRAFYTATSSGTSEASNSSVWGGIMAFDSTTRWSRLSWGLDFSYREASFTDRRTEFDQLNVASLTYAVTPEFKVTLRGNVETSNLVSLDSETTTGVGGGLRWTPSPRTNLVLEYDQRVFGSSHFYGFDYRTPRTVWAISSRQGLSTGQQFNNAQGVGGSPFDLLFAQFASIEPDPVARAQLVNNYLRTNGINPNAGLNTGFLPSQVTLERRQEASMAWLGARSSLIFNVYQTQTQAVDSTVLNPDSQFAGGNVIEWLGFGVNLSHRLTPLSTLSLNVDQRQTTETVGDQDTTLNFARVLWSTQLAERATLSVGARYQVQTGTSSFNEAALLANLSMQF